MWLLHKKRLLPLLGALLAIFLFYFLQLFIYQNDNKYTAGPPYGEKGMFTFDESDLHKPLFLIDGWLLDGQEVFIGQYTNFSYLPGRDSPFGKGTYRLTLCYSGAPRTLLLEIPKIFTSYRLTVNGVLTSGGPQVAVPVGGGNTQLVLVTENHSQYYSGLTYPPALGTPQVIGRLFAMRTLCYGAVCFSSLTLAIFSAILWARRKKDAIFLHFGLLCLALGLHCSHPFLWQLGLGGPLWQAVTDSAWMLVLAEVTAVAACTTGLNCSRWYRLCMRPATLGFCFFVFLAVLFIIPAFGDFIAVYGFLVDAFKLAVWACLALFTGIGFVRKEGSATVLTAVGILSISLITDVWDAGHFEPIAGLWQNEYAALALVLSFGALLVRRNVQLLREEEDLRTLSVQHRLATESALYMRESIEQVRRMKHEMGHHLEALSALWDANDLPRVKSYLQSLLAEKNRIPPLAYSKHFLVNAILSSYLGSAAKMGIQISFSVQVPEALSMADADLCILLSNLLQNAVEGCMDLPTSADRFIFFELRLKENLLVFSCRNSAKGCDSTGPFPTTKSKAQSHGLGLAGMEQVAVQYGGTLSACRKQGVFQVQGVLSLKSAL